MFKWLKNSLTKAVATGNEMAVKQLVDFLHIDADNNALSEATYFACLKVLGESMGKLPLKLLQSTPQNGVEKAVRHPLYSILKYRPNPYMTSAHFWSTVEYNRNHYGNAYVWIRGAGSKTSLWILPSENVQAWYDDACILAEAPNLWYIYTHEKNGRRLKFGSEEILHFKTSTSMDGVGGLSVQDILKTTLAGGRKAQATLNGLYDSGFTAKAVLQYTGNLSDPNVKAFVQGMERYATGKEDDVKNIIPIPVGSTLTPLNIKLTDAQFLELKKYTALQVAAAFGIKPNQINDYEKASYASAEAQQLAFYVDTLLYIIKQYEEELTYKLLTPAERARGLHFKFNVSVILRADLKTQIDSLSTAVQNAIYTPNEARAMLDAEKKPGGDQLYGNGNLIPLTMAGEQYKKGGGTDG